MGRRPGQHRSDWLWFHQSTQRSGSLTGASDRGGAQQPAEAQSQGVRRYTRCCSEEEEDDGMIIGVAQLSPVLSIIFGVLILIMPRFLNYLVAIYLILVGLLGLGWLR
jgi:hypothetical protein